MTWRRHPGGFDLRANLDGDRLLPIVSSSFESDDVSAARAEILGRTAARGPGNRGRRERFHRGHDPEAGPFSVCMHRDASTASLGRVAVTADEVAFVDEADPPCSAATAVTLGRASRTEGTAP